MLQRNHAFRGQISVDKRGAFNIIDIMFHVPIRKRATHELPDKVFRVHLTFSSLVHLGGTDQSRSYGSV